MAEALARPLRFGIMYDGSALHSFQAQAINALVERGVAEPALLIIDGREGSAQAQSAVIQRRLFAPNLLWRLYARFDQPRALARVPLPDYCVGLPRIVCAPTREGWSEYFSDADAAAIRSYDFDFILRFGFGIIRGKILDSARFGVWSFHHGDEARYRGGPPGFWEIYDGAAVSGAILQRLTDRLDSGIVLRRGYLKTLDYSYARNLNRLLLESADWPALVASDIRAGADVDRLPASRSQARIRRTPSNIEMLRFFPRLARNVVRRAFERTTREEWNVGVVRLSPKEVVAGGTVGQVRWVPPLPGGWVADPMAYAVNGDVHVLCERMRLKDDKGHIAAITFDGSRWSGEHVALDTGCHAAYPYIFEYDGSLYCVPETSEANEVRLFRAVRFPHQWERAGTPVSGVPAVDNTIFRYGEHWWLFFTLATASDHRLHAYHATQPLGTWQAHERNPIKIDVRSSRPAGPPFWFEGSLYRPAQDSSKTYGGRIAINRIVELTPSTFSEETIAHLEPARGRYGQALHTLSRAGDYWVIDGKRYRLRGFG